jgi:hypothetical protein
VDFRLFTPATAQLGAAQTAAAAGASPVMVWDGTALNLFFIGPFLLANVWHTTATSATNPTFGTPLRIGGTVLNSQCSAMSFNRRLHIACARFESGRSRIWYSTSTRGGIVGPPLGPLPWEPPSHVGLDDHAEPAIGAVGDEIYVVGINRDAILQYSRRDPHVRPYEWAGGLAPVERWLESGTDLDPSQRVRGLGLSDTRILSFNRDLYLTAARSVGSPSDGVYLVNFARAALRGFLVRRLGIGLGWGEDGDAQLIRPGDDTIAMGIGHYFLEDMNGDRRADLVRAAIVTGGGELRIARSLPDSATLLPSTLILSQFAHPSDFVQVGDVNGDGRKDIVRFFKNDGAWAAHTLLNSQGGFGTQLTSRDRRRTVENVDTVLLGDVTRDGRADMVIVRSGFANGSSAVIVAPGRTNGGFGSPQEWATTAAIFPDHPMLMDVNGDRAMDLVLIGSASSGLVRAALSTTTSFASPTQWGPALSNLCASFLAADMDQDGRDDLLCFVRDKPGVPGEPRAAYVLFAENGRFSLPNTLISRFGGVNDLPLVGNFSPDTKGDYTHVAADNARLVFDLMTVRFTDGRVGWRSALAQFPVPSGAPWENYRFFTEKGIGATMFPDWLWGPTPCVRPGHRFFLIGAAGNGGPSFTHLSVRPGSAETHVLEELGHSAFANCFRENNDTLGLFDDIFTIPLSAGGFDANSFNDTCGAGPAPWVDCRDPEHFFLRFMLTYRTNGTVIRNTIEQESDPAKRARYQARYAWLRTHWFNGVEFYVDATDVEGRRDTVGLPCLRGQCPGVGGKLDGIQ